MISNKFGVSYLGYQPALDGLRAVAVLLVMFAHANFQLGGNGAIGVDIFFVLSGFLITTLLLEENEKHANISFKGFYIRRATRLFPSLYMLLLFLIGYAILIANNELRKILQEEIVSSAFYLRNISWSWGYANNDKLLGHTWSLAVEEQFYLVWPVILFYCIRHLRLLIFGLSLFILISFWVKGAYKLPYLYGAIIYESIFIGCAAALFRWRNWIPSNIHFGISIFCILILIIIGLSDAFFYKQLYNVGLRGIFGILAAISILGILNKSNIIIDVLLSNKLAIGIGKISYGLYLWHVPVFRLFKMHSPFQPAISFILKFGVTFLIAWLSYEYVEKRIIQFGRNYTKRVANKV